MVDFILQVYGHNNKKCQGIQKDSHANTNQRKVGVATLISDKADFRERKTFRDGEEYYIMLKG